MGGRDHSETCATCGMQRGGLNDDKCACDDAAPSSTPRRYAKKPAIVRAVQWLGASTWQGVRDLIGFNPAHHNVGNGQLELGYGRYARHGDWLLSTSGEDVTVHADDTFRLTYEDFDGALSRARPTDDEHEADYKVVVQQIDALIVAGLRLSREPHPDIFRDRDTIVRGLRRLLEDHAYVTARRERQRILEKIAKELAP